MTNCFPSRAQQRAAVAGERIVDGVDVNVGIQSFTSLTNSVVHFGNSGVGMYRRKSRTPRVT